MRPRLPGMALATIAALALLAACGGDDGDGAGDPTQPAQTAAASTPGGAPTADATEGALAQELALLEGIVLELSEVPPGFVVRNSQPVTKREAAVANVGIPPLAEYINGSDLNGAWAELFTREMPDSAISSIVYGFATSAGSTGLVDTIASLTAEDYPMAISVTHGGGEAIGDKSVLTEYVIPGGRTLEYTWAQGPLAGQVILRYAGDVPSNPDDALLLQSLAHQQAARMAAALE